MKPKKLFSKWNLRSKNQMSSYSKRSSQGKEIKLNTQLLKYHQNSIKCLRIQNRIFTKKDDRSQNLNIFLYNTIIIPIPPLLNNRDNREIWCNFHYYNKIKIKRKIHNNVMINKEVINPF